MEAKSFFSQGYVRFLITLALIGLVVALGAYSYLTLREAKYVYTGPTNITVRGEGEVFAKPDIGQFSFSVMTEAEDATAAQTESAEATNAIIDYLKEQGVEERDIKTTSYNLNPRYRYEERVCPQGSFCPPGERIMDGFEVNQRIQVKVRDLEASGDLISGVGQRGATNISGLSFTIDDPATLQAEAREQAIVEAKDKANELAEDLGVRLVRMTGFWEDEGGYPRPYYDGMGGDMAVEEARVSTAPQMPTGESTITSRVNITYEVR